MCGGRQTKNENSKNGCLEHSGTLFSSGTRKNLCPVFVNWRSSWKMAVYAVRDSIFDANESFKIPTEHSVHKPMEAELMEEKK